MAKKRKMFDEIREGLEAYRDRPDTLTRREFSVMDVKAIREQIGLSQGQLAAFLNVSKRTLENWEQKRRSPAGPAQTLLRIMQKEPKAIMRALLT